MLGKCVPAFVLAIGVLGFGTARAEESRFGVGLSSVYNDGSSGQQGGLAFLGLELERFALDGVASFSLLNMVAVDLNLGYAQEAYGTGTTVPRYARLGVGLMFGDRNGFRAGPAMQTELSVHTSELFAERRVVPSLQAWLHVLYGFHAGASVGRAFLVDNSGQFASEGVVAALNGALLF